MANVMVYECETYDLKEEQLMMSASLHLRLSVVCGHQQRPTIRVD